jgi:hypothetical protein
MARTLKTWCQSVDHFAAKISIQTEGTFIGGFYKSRNNRTSASVLVVLIFFSCSSRSVKRSLLYPTLISFKFYHLKTFVMRRVSFFLVLASFVACNSDKEAKVQSMSTKDTTSVETINYPPVDNSIKFEIADPAITAQMLEVYKGWQDNNIDLMKKHLADTLTLVLSDGTMIFGSRDSVSTVMQHYRNDYTSVEPQYHSFVSLKSTDRNDTWFVMWYKEFQTDTKGKKDWVELQENWKLNQDGKVVALYQYAQSRPAADKK